MANNRRPNPEGRRRATRDEALAAMRTAWAVLRDAGALVPTTECASYHPNESETLRATKTILDGWGRKWDPAEKAVTDPAMRTMIADRVLAALFDEHFDGGLR